MRIIRNELYVASRPPADPASVAVRVGESVITVVSTAVPFLPGHGRGRVTDEHVRAEIDEADPAWLAVADVIVRSGPIDGSPSGCGLMAVLDGPRERVVVRGTEWVIDAPALDPPGLFASFVHTWLVTGRPLASLAHASVLTADPECRPVRLRRAPRSRPAVS